MFLVSTAKGQIHSIARRLLDPRRHKDKPSAADGEELLIPYDPLIPDDHRRVLSKEFDVGQTLLPCTVYPHSHLFAHTGLWSEDYPELSSAARIYIPRLRTRPGSILHQNISIGDVRSAKRVFQQDPTCAYDCRAVSCNPSHKAHRAEETVEATVVFVDHRSIILG